MSILRPSDPTLPPDPLGSKADIHLTAATQTVTLMILILLNATVFKGGTLPSDITMAVSPLASYLVSVLAGHKARRQLLRYCHRAQASQEPQKGPEGP